MNLGRRIREARLQKQLTQKDVVGDYMTRNMLSKIENSSATPSVKTLEYLSKALDLPVSYFVSEGAESSQPEQLEEIIKLTELLPGDEKTAAIALCIKARALMAARSPESALALLESVPQASLGSEGFLIVCKTMEDCCTLLGDYKRAYDIALKRIEVKA